VSPYIPEEESPVQQLQLMTQEVDGHAVVHLKGELDIATVDDLRNNLRQTRQSYGEHVILDLTDLEFMDSQGLSVIVACHKSVTAAGGSLALVAPRPIVRRTLEITGLSGRLAVFDSVEEAAAPRETAAS
jgi:anti-sigma B factor antagonist